MARREVYKEGKKYSITSHIPPNYFTLTLEYTIFYECKAWPSNTLY